MSVCSKRVSRQLSTHFGRILIKTVNAPTNVIIPAAVAKPNPSRTLPVSAQADSSCKGASITSILLSLNTALSDLSLMSLCVLCEFLFELLRVEFKGVSFSSGGTLKARYLFPLISSHMKSGLQRDID